MSKNIDLKLFEKEISSSKSEALMEIKKRALDTLKETGIPNKSHENWKYTDITRPIELVQKYLTNKKNEKELNSNSSSTAVNEIDAHWINLSAFSLKSEFSINVEDVDISISLLSTSNENFDIQINDPISCLNALLIKDVIKITIPKNSSIEKPLGIIWTNSPKQNDFCSNLRCIVDIEENSNINLINIFQNEISEEYFINSVMEIDIEKNSNVEYLKIQNFNANHHSIDRCLVNLDTNASINFNNIDIGSKLSRSDVEVNLNQKGARASVNGVYLCEENQHIDNHIWSNHFSELTTSTQNFYGIIGKKGHCVFNGKALINEKASGAEANQYNHNILLDDDASIDTKPELEIYTDDVKCSHGSTVGQLDENALYYMRSRGIDLKTAKTMLISAFVQKILSLIKIKSTQNYLDQLITTKLAKL